MCGQASASFLKVRANARLFKDKYMEFWQGREKWYLNIWSLFIQASKIFSDVREKHWPVIEAHDFLSIVFKNKNT